MGKEGPGPQEPLTQEAASFPPEDDGSSDLDLEQLMEDIGEPEEGGTGSRGTALRSSWRPFLRSSGPGPPTAVCLSAFLSS